jgi:tetratricopeptide (TPR) repeat protein
MEKIINKILFFILCLLLSIIPFFFLNITQEYFVTSKFYLLGFGILVLMLVSTVKILITKKISWQKKPFDNLILIFLTSVTISTLFSSPNIIQALLNPNFGLATMVFLVILYFYISRIQSRVGHARSLQLISIILSVITIIFYFQPFKNVSLPQNFAFLKNPTFTPIGSQLDLAILLGFFLIIQISYLLIKKQLILHSSFLILNFLALFLTVYSLVKPAILPPWRLSWFAVLETMKNPRTALIGIGPDNFSAIFTKVKDFTYNQSPLWQINSFSISRSAILQIFTEVGIVGLLSFCILIFSVFKPITKQWNNEAMKPLFFVFIYLLICLFMFPASLITWFLFFIVLGLVSQQLNNETAKQSTDLSNLMPLYLGIVVISFGLIGASAYLLGRSYASEYFFKKSINGAVANNAKLVYDNQRKAIILNPFIERFRSNFAQTNLLIANNLVQKDSKKINEQDRQVITQAIQSSIAEGKAVVSLNPQKAGNWQALAQIYLNIINLAQGADVWTISAYQRAILADPQNPVYRVGLGGVYYSLNKYDDALKFFEQAVALKPNWPNASYNYAWANFQKKNYPLAVNALQATLKLLDPKTNKTDYEKVKKELEEFKKMLPKEEGQVKIPEEKNLPGILNLPTSPNSQINPKLELPKDASPEAK